MIKSMFVAALSLCLMAELAQAQRYCPPHDQAVAQLNERHNEWRIGSGISRWGNIVELFISEAGTWTILVTRPEGSSCVVASGGDWESEPLIPGEPT